LETWRSGTQEGRNSQRVLQRFSQRRKH
jgi:hypothetical protein